MSINKFTTNQIASLIVIAFSIFYLILAFQIPEYALPRPVDSDLFPKVLGFFMLLLGILLFFEKDDETSEKEEVEEEEEKLPWYRTGGGEIAVTILSVIAYILLLEIVGFVLTTVLFIFGLTWFYGYKRFVVNGIVSVVIGFGFYMILTRGLGVYLPPGILGF
ncbi:putative tricarboxylic transport membrane protein [Salsuginibacillus halophilus]|uniref:Putative tricarboxylic transport membrane protein n=1 Tax=Salsuginibacillus halophilus TaxID=517424 RepID=A0A2P8H973_9BACI|nr:tripartite tricarboxylate transporter TctB family protein [Salsuginibacillus halophilus]PSL42775.1 putative tricarboxylic transport membrane protein [Salsuginibacillus halophilus]